MHWCHACCTNLVNSELNTKTAQDGSYSSSNQAGITLISSVIGNFLIILDLQDFFRLDFLLVDAKGSISLEIKRFTWTNYKNLNKKLLRLYI